MESENKKYTSCFLIYNGQNVVLLPWRKKWNTIIKIKCIFFSSYDYSEKKEKNIIYIKLDSDGNKSCEKWKSVIKAISCSEVCNWKCLKEDISHPFRPFFPKILGNVSLHVCFFFLLVFHYLVRAMGGCEFPWPRFQQGPRAGAAA